MLFERHHKRNEKKTIDLFLEYTFKKTSKSQYENK
jgi:hypothetical protein